MLRFDRSCMSSRSIRKVQEQGCDSAKVVVNIITTAVKNAYCNAYVRYQRTTPTC